MLKDDLYVFFKEYFHDNGVIGGQLRASFIALIPKKEGDLSIKNFQPISLTGSLYKILANILANHLRKVLLEVIFSKQGAFVDGRQILHSVLIAHECSNSRNRQNLKASGYDFCKLGFEKAYGMVDWGFLQ